MAAPLAPVEPAVPERAPIEPHALRMLVPVALATGLATALLPPLACALLVAAALGVRHVAPPLPEWLGYVGWLLLILALPIMWFLADQGFRLFDRHVGQCNKYCFVPSQSITSSWLYSPTARCGQGVLICILENCASLYTIHLQKSRPFSKAEKTYYTYLSAVNVHYLSNRIAVTNRCH